MAWQQTFGFFEKSIAKNKGNAVVLVFQNCRQTVKIPFLLWAIHNTPNFRIVIGFFEQNLAKTISVYVHKSNDLRRLPKVIFIENFCYWSLQQQWQKTATWRSQQLSAWIFYPIFVSNAKSQVFRSFFLGYVRNILHVATMK